MASLPLGGQAPARLEGTHQATPHQAHQAQPQPSPPPPVIEVVDSIQTAWDAYSTHIKKWFYHPDLEAARITLAAAASHFHKDCDPCWLFILGPSSGDKTSICINSLLALPQVYMQGDITSKTFLSGYTGTAHSSLLHKIGSGILAFKDFTTFMSKRPEEQSEIASQFREIYDGSFVKNTGKGVTITWEGKITVIAAATPALERAWSSKRDLGERFLQVRISRKDGVLQSEYAQRQRGYEEHITVTMRKLALAFFQMDPPITNPPPKLSPSQMSRVANMAELISYCRGMVPRHQVTNAIIDVPQIENSGRVSKSLASLIANHAALFRRAAIEEEDMGIGNRVALNSIPSTRMLVIAAVPLVGSIGTDVITASSSLPESTIATNIADLECLGVLKVQHNEVIANQISLTPAIANLWRGAFELLPDPLPQSQSHSDQAVQYPRQQGQGASSVH